MYRGTMAHRRWWYNKHDDTSELSFGLSYNNNNNSDC